MLLFLILTANVATPPPVFIPILIVPSFVTAITSSIEKSTPASFFTVQRVFSLPLRSKQSLQSSKSA
uniref:Putative ovule protein n=1 Tax=Solanum chacoense TaxID=4108 RepID=A0A0V0GKE2_SOLCH